MSSNIFSSTHLFGWLLTQIGSLVFYEYTNLFLTSKHPPTDTSSEVRPIIGIIDGWCSTCQHWNSSSLILLLDYCFLLPILFHLTISSYLLNLLFATQSLQATINYWYIILLISECIYGSNHCLILRWFVVYFAVTEVLNKRVQYA